MAVIVKMHGTVYTSHKVFGKLIAIALFPNLFIAYKIIPIVLLKKLVLFLSETTGGFLIRQEQ